MIPTSRDRLQALLEPGVIRRIAVFRALQLGDLLCAVPVLRSLRAAFPEARIDLIGLPWAHAFAERFSAYLDGFVEFPGYPGIMEAPLEPSRTAAFLAAAQAGPWDLALQLHGSGLNSNPFVALLGARHTAGFYLPGQFCPDPDLCIPYPGHGPEPLRLLAWPRALGLPETGEGIEFPLLDADRAEYEALAGRLRLRHDDYVCIHAGARAPERRWPVENFAAIADSFAAAGYRVLLTGSEAERTIVSHLAESMTHPAEDLAGQTSLGALACLLEGAALLVTNDTGVSHLAAALKAPSVVIFSASDPERWAPLDSVRHRALVGPAAEVNACCDWTTPHSCLRDACRLRPLPRRDLAPVTPREVLAAAEDLLGNHHLQPAVESEAGAAGPRSPMSYRRTK